MLLRHFVLQFLEDEHQLRGLDVAASLPLAAFGCCRHARARAPCRARPHIAHAEVRTHACRGLRLRDGANWLKQSSQCRTVRGVPSLISALQQAGEAPAQCGPLALRFFLAMRTDAFRSWRTASQPSFELCAEQHAVERRPNDPHTRCCCGLVNVNDDCPFTPRGGDDACRLYNRRWCCVSCGVLKTVTSNNKTLHT